MGDKSLGSRFSIVLRKRLKGPQASRQAKPNEHHQEWNNNELRRITLATILFCQLIALLGCSQQPQ